VKLLLVRHGPAEDRDAWRARGQAEFHRPLTEVGKRRTREAARGLARLLPSPEALATSPLARAMETTHLVAAAFGVAQVEELRALEPGCLPADAMPWLRSRERLGLVALVGHEPHLGRLAGWLLCGADRPVVRLRKAGAALLDLGDHPQAGGARLEWLLAPAHLRRLGR
jgi:phosphohistidine phosphatase